jgi:putative oxidoreductase
MMQSIFATDQSAITLILRLVLGLVIVPHGLQKLFGWFGGYGYQGTMGFLTGTMKLPYAVGLLVILAESFGALGVIFGAATRLGALGILAVMIGAALTAHLPHGFFMNWSGQQKGEGYEYHLLAGAIAIALIILGGGAFSVDAWLAAQLAS